MIDYNTLAIIMLFSAGIGAVGLRIVQLSYARYLDAKEQLDSEQDSKQDFRLNVKQAHKWEQDDE